MSQALDQTLTVAELEQLETIISQINQVLQNAGKNISYFDALHRINTIVNMNMELLQKTPDILQSISEAEYSLAYNSLIDGTPPINIKNNVLPEVWDKLDKEGVIYDMALYHIVNNLADNNFNEAKKWFNIYKDYIPKEQAAELSVLLSNDMLQLVSAVNNEDSTSIINIIEKIEGKGKYEEYRNIISRYLGLNLDELRRNAYADYIYSLLEEANDIDEAYARLENSREVAKKAGLEDLVSDIEHGKLAIDRARAGDVSGFLFEASEISDVNILRFVLTRGIPELMATNPEAITNLPDSQKTKLQALLNTAELDLDINNLEKLAEGYKVVVNLNNLIREDKPEEALDLWMSLNPEIKAIVATIVGETIQDIEQGLRDTVFAKNVVTKTSDLINLLKNGNYVDAYNYWTSLSDKEREAISSLLEEELEDLDEAIRIVAALQELSQIENPTLEQVKTIFAKYISSDEADRIARELLEESPLYNAKELADQGRYDDALEKALEAGEEERKIAMLYIINAINEAGGPEEVAIFVAKYKDVLRKYLPDILLGLVEVVEDASEIADDLANAISVTAVRELQDRITKIINKFRKSVEEQDWETAERILIENRVLLEKITDEQGSLFDIMSESLSLSRAMVWLNESANKLDILANSIGKKDLLPELRSLETRAEVLYQQLDNLKHVDETIVNEIKESYKRLLSYIYALESQAYMIKGDLANAVSAAEKAKQYNDELNELYETVKVFSMAVSDKDNLASNLNCILENMISLSINKESAEIEKKQRNKRIRVI